MLQFCLYTAGCDALAVHLVLMGVACTLQIPQGTFLIASTFCVFGPWLLAHWEEYHTGAQQGAAGRSRVQQGRAVTAEQGCGSRAQQGPAGPSRARPRRRLAGALLGCARACTRDKHACCPCAAHWPSWLCGLPTCCLARPVALLASRLPSLRLRLQTLCPCCCIPAGIMVYGNGYFGVTEANYAVVLLHVWGYLMG